MHRVKKGSCLVVLCLDFEFAELSISVPEQGSRPAHQDCLRTGSQSVVPGPAPSRNLLDRYILGPSPRSTESDTPGMGPSKLCVFRPSR